MSIPSDLFTKLRYLYPSDIFTKLGTPPYAIPKYHSHISPTFFSDTPSAIKHWILPAFLSKHRHKRVHNKRILLFSWIMADGLGDLYTLLTTKTLLEKSLPNNIISAIIVTTPHVTLQIPDDITIISEEAPSLTKDIISLISSASMVIEIPTKYPHFQSTIGRHISDTTPTIHIGQYGFINSKDFHPKTKNICMGVHSLERGLLFDKIFDAPHGNTYFAYLKSPNGYKNYIHAILHNEQNSSQDITLITCNLLPLLRFLEKSSFKGISQVIIHDGESKTTLHHNRGKKKLIVQSLLSPSREVIIDKMCKSKIFVGCRGDRSFNECIELGKCFFYDPPDHSLPFLKDLLQMVRHYLPGCPSLERYIHLLHSRDNIGDEIGGLLSDHSLHYSMQQLRKLLIESWSFNDILLDIIKSHFTYTENPQLSIKDKKELSEFSDGKISLNSLLK